MAKKKIIPVVLVLAVVVAVFAARGWRRGANGRILVSGNIELTEADIGFKTPGKLLELRVAEGDQVRKDAVIARLDREQVSRQRASAQAAREAAASGLQQLQTAIAWQRETLAADNELRRAELRQAEARLNDLLAGSRPQEIQQARAAAAQTRAEHEQARKDWDRAQVLYKDDDISTAQRDQFRTRFDATAEALRQAEQRLALVEEGPRRHDIEAARAQVERARASLRLSEATRLELRRREEEQAARRAEVERAQAQIAVIDSQLDDTIASAPFDGVVLVKSAEPGEVVAAGTSVVKIGDLDRPWLRAYINERDLGRVKLGGKVRLTTDSFPGKTYPGRVSFIASEAEFTPKQIQTAEERVKLVYRIKIDVENPRHELKLNMPVDAEILAEEK